MLRFSARPAQRTLWGVLLAAAWLGNSLMSFALPVANQLTALSLDRTTGQLQATTQNPVSPQVIRYPKSLPNGGNAVRTIWEFPKTSLSTGLTARQLAEQWQPLGVLQVQLTQYPGPIVRLVVDVQAVRAETLASSAALGASTSPSLALVIPGFYDAVTPPASTLSTTSSRYKAEPMVLASTITTDSAPEPLPARSVTPTPALSSNATALQSQLTAAIRQTQQLERENSLLASRIDQLEAELKTAKARPATGPLASSTSTAAKSPTGSPLAAMQQALAQSKAALAKSIETINQQNSAIQTLKIQMAELKGGVSVASLDQQTWLDQQLTQAQQAQKRLQTELDDLKRENQSLKLVVDRIQKSDGAVNAMAISPR